VVLNIRRIIYLNSGLCLHVSIVLIHVAEDFALVLVWCLLLLIKRLLVLCKLLGEQLALLV
jgi:hypothetical protein